jgi:hypothetical protein
MEPYKKVFQIWNLTKRSSKEQNLTKRSSVEQNLTKRSSVRKNVTDQETKLSAEPYKKVFRNGTLQKGLPSRTLQKGLLNM